MPQRNKKRKRDDGGAAGAVAEGGVAAMAEGGVAAMAEGEKEHSICNICLEADAVVDYAGNNCDSGHFFHKGCLQQCATQFCTECPVCQKPFSHIVDGRGTNAVKVEARARPVAEDAIGLGDVADLHSDLIEAVTAHAREEARSAGRAGTRLHVQFDFQREGRTFATILIPVDV
jgi:hypothetical protein